MQEEQWMEVDYCCESDRVSVGDLPPCLTLPLRQLTNAMIFIILATKNRILISYIKLLLSYLPPCLTVYLLHLTIEMIFIFWSPKKRISISWNDILVGVIKLSSSLPYFASNTGDR